MPSPPDVILVLSPRMAKLVKYVARYMVNGTELGEHFAVEDRHFALPDWTEDDAYKALDALLTEIDNQLANERGATTRVEEPVQFDSSASDVARIAAKMAKAARGAVEPDYGDISEDQSPEAIARQVEEADTRYEAIKQERDDDLRGPADGLKGE